MLKKNKKILIALLYVFSISTLINSLIMYWFPIVMPTTSFIAIRLVFVSFTEKRYYLLGISIAICILLLLTIFSVNKNRIFIPILSFIYTFIDFATVLCRFIDGLDDGYWIMYIAHLVLLITITMLLFSYIRNSLFKKKTR